jgi:hypothetical protein
MEGLDWGNESKKEKMKKIIRMRSKGEEFRSHNGQSLQLFDSGIEIMADLKDQHNGAFQGNHIRTGH